MTNTYFAPGDATPEDLIAGTERGLYAVSFGGGQVEPATGDFVFGVSEGYLIEDGKVTAPVRGATLIGNGLEALGAVDGIAADLEIATGLLRQGRPARRPPASGSPTCGSRRSPSEGRDDASSRPPRPRSRPRKLSARTDAEAWAEERQGLEVRVYKEAVEWLTRRRRPRARPARVRRRPLGLRVRNRPLARRACARWRRARTPARRPPTTDEYGGLPDVVRRRPRSRASTRTRWRNGPPSARSSSRLAVDARRARARGRDAGGADRLRRLARAGRDRQQPRLHLRLRGHLGVGVLVGVRGRGRRPDDRAGRRAGA